MEIVTPGVRGGLRLAKLVSGLGGKRLIRVTDDGCGMAPEELEKIFDPFFSTKSQGTGLGLAVSYGIIKNHRGTIKAYSEPGQGTRFVVELPITNQKITEKAFDEIQAYSSH